MFDKKYEDRLLLWREFRESLETSDDPLQDVVSFYSSAPLVSIQTDPYTQENWPTPWEIIKENNYCAFVKILAISYTLQLCERFIGTNFEINIVRDNNRSSTEYLLFVDDMCIGYDLQHVVPRTKLPNNMTLETSYTMPSLD